MTSPSCVILQYESLGLPLLDGLSCVSPPKSNLINVSAYGRDRDDACGHEHRHGLLLEFGHLYY